MTGTQNFAAIAGAGAAIEYLAGIGRTLGESGSRRACLASALTAVEHYERRACERLLAAVSSLPSIRIRGITDPKRLSERVPTVSFTHRRLSPLQVAAHLASRNIFAWHGNYYALPLTEALGLEPDGLVRVGLLHYNTAAEINRLADALAEMD
jgi:selenocysteine lyase/cysteine desulfurase